MSQSLEDLALQISSLTYTVSQALKSQNANPLTSGSDASVIRLLPQDVRTQLCQATMDLHNLVLGPEDRLRRMAIEWSSPTALRYIIHFSLASYVPTTGTISYDKLASAANVPVAHLKRILRLAMTNDLFCEVAPLEVAHTPLSLLLTQPALNDYVAHCLEFSFPVAVKMPEMSTRWGGSEEKVHTAFNIAFNSDLPLFGWLKGQPEHARRFAGLMGAMRKSPSWDVRHLVEGYEWTGVSKVVDVGGSVGHASVAIAERCEGVKCVVQDLGYVIDSARESGAVPEGVRERVELMGHDFFSEQTVVDGDVYLLRQILHDWPDASAVQILRGIVPAMKKEGARILIMDQVVPEPGALPKTQEREARTVDLVVMSHFNGKQRDLNDWESVVKEADLRLKINRVIQPRGSHFAIIEVVLGVEPTTNGTHPVAEESVAANSVEAGETEPEPTTNRTHEAAKECDAPHPVKIEDIKTEPEIVRIGKGEGNGIPTNAASDGAANGIELRTDTSENAIPAAEKAPSPA